MAAYNMRRLPLLHSLLREFYSFQVEDINADFIYDTLPLLFDVFLCSKVKIIPKFIDSIAASNTVYQNLKKKYYRDYFKYCRGSMTLEFKLPFTVQFYGGFIPFSHQNILQAISIVIMRKKKEKYVDTQDSEFCIQNNSKMTVVIGVVQWYFRG